MDIYIKQSDSNEIDADALIVGVYKDELITICRNEFVNNNIENLNDLSGDFGKVRVYYPAGEFNARRLIIIGLGSKDKIDLEKLRISIAKSVKQVKDFDVKSIAIDVDSFVIEFNIQDVVYSLVESTLLTLYDYSNDDLYELRKNGNIENLLLVTTSEIKEIELEKSVERAEAVVGGVYLSRDLINMPPNKATPSYLANIALNIGENYGMRVTIGDKNWAKNNNMGAFLAVAKGAGEPPKFIVMEHNNTLENSPAIVIIGKGITFDSGGISLKPSQDMGKMKSDMAGASVVLGVMRVVGALNLPYRIVGIAPCTENMPDGNAYRPADVIKASNGKTIEIISTDAEGRMVLADGLVFANTFSPEVVIDLATLTGSCVVALGKGVAAGLFSNDENISKHLIESSLSTYERLWSLPLFEDYSETIKSTVADIKNSGGRFGGVGTSAAFLQEFVNFPWAHIDMAGMALADKEKGYIPEGGTGFGVRLIVDFIINWKESV